MVSSAQINVGKIDDSFIDIAINVTNIVANPTYVIRSSADEITITCYFEDYVNGEASDYRCKFYFKDAYDVEYGPFDATISKTGDNTFEAVYSFDPDASWAITNYMVKIIIELKQ